MSTLERSRYEQLVDELGVGRGAARTREDLAASLGISDRKLRELVEGLRNDGVLVGSSNGPAGYFLIATEDELAETAKHLRSRAISCLQTVHAMRKTAAHRFGAETALTLFDLDGAW